MIPTMNQDWTNRYGSCTLLRRSDIEIILYLKEGITIASAHGRSLESIA
jgi:hypothetical protein